jgi:hypothetical protein
VSNTAQVSNAAQIISAQADLETAIPDRAVATYADLGVSAAARALVDSEGIRMVAEPVAALARLTGHSRVLIAGCRQGDGASTVAGALALDLAVRLGVDTLLVGADGAAGGYAAETRAGGNGRPLRINPSGLAHLWTARCAHIVDPARYTGMPVNGERADQTDLIEELSQVMGRYRAAVVDLGVVRLNARMLAVARPDDPVLVVARYGCSRRDELAATMAVVNLGHRSIGGVILNGYESPAIDRLQWIPGLRENGR